jgi:hypothetical protein
MANGIGARGTGIGNNHDRPAESKSFGKIKSMTLALIMHNALRLPPVHTRCFRGLPIIGLSKAHPSACSAQDDWQMLRGLPPSLMPRSVGSEQKDLGCPIHPGHLPPRQLRGWQARWQLDFGRMLDPLPAHIKEAYRLENRAPSSESFRIGAPIQSMRGHNSSACNDNAGTPICGLGIGEQHVVCFSLDLRSFVSSSLKSLRREVKHGRVCFVSRIDKEHFEGEEEEG